uniref:MULE transposase domain-containing protein n=1 Tax=Lactuca sativa TaxID=4236 RepID=A0A9R1XUZ1_LACSA|nr:hypothetical protein LSAT_V11C100009660 [Lactuca sativa]
MFIFKSLNLAAKMYTDYAKMTVFHIRLSSQSKYNSQIIKNKYVICNRGGKDKLKPCDMLATSSFKRKPNSNKIIMGTIDYKVKQFFELHNHPLESIEDRPYMKKARHMSYSEKEFLVRASKAKIGLVMAHKIRSVLKGGYKYVGTKVTIYKNLRRGENKILCYKDAQIMINKMNDHRDHYPNYSFELLCDGDQLAAMYKMVFVPFTSVDHHKKLVTVGVGLLSRETIESYKWLLKALLRAHEGKAPKIVLTNQDPTIKQAVESVLPNSRHRLFMWHIMKKLQEKE